MSHIDYPNNNNPDNSAVPNYSSQSEFNSALNKGDRGYYGNDNGGPFPNSNSQMALYVLVSGALNAGQHRPPSSAPLGMWADVSDSGTWGPLGLNPPANWKEATPLYSATANYAAAALVQDREARSSETLGSIIDDNGAVASPRFSNKPPNSNLKK